MLSYLLLQSFPDSLVAHIGRGLVLAVKSRCPPLPVAPEVLLDGLRGRALRPCPAPHGHGRRWRCGCHDIGECGVWARSDRVGALAGP